MFCLSICVGYVGCVVDVCVCVCMCGCAEWQFGDRVAWIASVSVASQIALEFGQNCQTDCLRSSAHKQVRAMCVLLRLNSRLFVYCVVQ